MIRSGIISIGHVPGSNGDAAAVIHAENGADILAVADGVGSYSGGALAAKLAINALRAESFSKGSKGLAEIFKRIKAQLEIESSGLKLGTTLTAAVVQHGVVNVAHVGDCRVYHIRRAGLITRTKDQTEVQYLLDKGVINKFQAHTYPRANVLMSVLAPGREYTLFEVEFHVVPGDRILVCSDGFYRATKKAELLSISSSASSFSEFESALKFASERATFRDDATCVFAEV